MADESSGMLIPRYFDFFKPFDPSPEPAPVRSFRTASSQEALAGRQGPLKALERPLGEDRRLILTCAPRMLSKGGAFEEALEFREGLATHEPRLSPLEERRLSAPIDCDEKMSFFEYWLEAKPKGPYLAYDAASFSARAKGPPCAEDLMETKGDGGRLPRLSFGRRFSRTTSLPVFYVPYPGPAEGKSQLPRLTASKAELGVADICLIMGKGFCQASNTKFMAAKSLSFVSGADDRDKAARRAKARGDIVSPGRRARQRPVRHDRAGPLFRSRGGDWLAPRSGDRRAPKKGLAPPNRLQRKLSSPEA